MALLIVALLLAAIPVAASAGPLLEVTSHADGDWTTSREVVLEGTAAPDARSVLLEREDFAHGVHRNLRWVDDNLTFRPERLFSDDFSDQELDNETWVVLEDPGNVTVEGGQLKLNWQYWQTTYPLVRTRDPIPSRDGDMVTEFKMKALYYSYVGVGGGVSKNSTDPMGSHLAYYVKYDFPVVAKVLAKGKAMYNQTGYDMDPHVYTLRYSARDGRHTALMDGEVLGTLPATDHPDTFWFGKVEEPTGPYQYYPLITVDYVDSWAMSGEWTSDVIEMGHRVVIDEVDPTWTSTHGRQAEVELEVRASRDGVEWSDWVMVEDTRLASAVEGTYLQLRVRLAFPDLRKATASIAISAIELGYHCPLVSVEARRAGAAWSLAEGLSHWSAALGLREDDNLVEVRVTDTSGAVTTGSLQLTVDTTPPTGSVAIATDREYVNDPAVTLLLDAEDRYGVERVEVSNSADFYQSETFPYSETLDWTLDGAEGENRVYARFYDSHGLRSRASFDRILFDSFPPMGAVTIMEEGEYTSSATVDLEVEYSDNNGVVSVEVSNREDLSDALVLEEGQTVVEGWELAEGGDGPRTVHVRVTDVAGNTARVSDSIELYIPKALGAVTIGEGAGVTSKPAVQLFIDVPLGHRPKLMQVSNRPDFDGATWEAVEDEKLWLLSPGDGEKEVYVRFIDFRDIVSLPVSDTVFLDTTPPRVTVAIDGGARYTTVPNVSVEVDLEDSTEPVRMWVTRDGVYQHAEPRKVVDAFDWTVPARESDHFVYVTVEDMAGNIGEGLASIHFATNHPQASLILPEGRMYGSVDRIPVEVVAIDYYGGIQVQLAFDRVPSATDPWVDLNGLLYAEVPDAAEDGSHQVRARVRNAAGLTSGVVRAYLVIDTSPPELVIVHPPDGAVVPQRGLRVLLEVEAEDPNNVSRLSFAVDDGVPEDLPTGSFSTNVTLEGFGEHVIRVEAEDPAGNVATSVSTFRLRREASPGGASAGTALLLALTVIAALGALAYGGLRTRTPGPRRARIAPGDGWHEEFTHPVLEEGDASEVGPPEEAPSPPPKAEASQDGGEEGPGPALDELEEVEIPATELEPVDQSSDWEEF